MPKSGKPDFGCKRGRGRLRSARGEVFAAGLPVGRVGEGEDVAQQILGFMTNGFMTGSIVYLDGGGSVV